VDSSGEHIRLCFGEDWPTVLTDLPETYVDVTMLATYAWEPGAELRLYSGATRQQPTNGMFSFAPCLPADVGAQGSRDRQSGWTSSRRI
jgi:hypothetical protein